ncbi:MAG: LysM peptidoglycan-binding domain-containing protein [Candidatus Saccharimonadales bacterium]
MAASEFGRLITQEADAFAQSQAPDNHASERGGIFDDRRRQASGAVLAAIITATSTFGAIGGFDTEPAAAQTPNAITATIGISQTTLANEISSPLGLMGEPTSAIQAEKPREGIVTVQKGQTESKIAAEYGESPKLIAALNNATNPDPDQIKIGQRLRVKMPSDPAELSTHHVATGQTLSQIAQSHGLSVAQLAAFNNLTNPNQIYAGQTLITGLKPPEQTANNHAASQPEAPAAPKSQEPTAKPTSANNLLKTLQSALGEDSTDQPPSQPPAAKSSTAPVSTVKPASANNLLETLRSALGQEPSPAQPSGQAAAPTAEKPNQPKPDQSTSAKPAQSSGESAIMATIDRLFADQNNASESQEPAAKAPILPSMVPKNLRGPIIQAAGQYNTDPRALASVLFTENRGWPNADQQDWQTSPTGAEGPLQFEPATWDAYKKATNQPNANPNNMSTALNAASWLLASNGGQQGAPLGSPSDPLKPGTQSLAVAKYNEGGANAEHDRQTGVINPQTKQYLGIWHRTVTSLNAAAKQEAAAATQPAAATSHATTTTTATVSPSAAAPNQTPATQPKPSDAINHHQLQGLNETSSADHNQKPASSKNTNRPPATSAETASPAPAASSANIQPVKSGEHDGVEAMINAYAGISYYVGPDGQLTITNNAAGQQ